MVYVLNGDGSPLMPCTEAKARHLIQKKMAVVVERMPFTIRLCFQVNGNSAHDVILGIDAGSKTIGISATSGNRVLYEAEVAIRQDISRLIEARNILRSSRRGRKTRYRKPRFDNRRKPEGWLPPSIEAKVRAHVNAIADACAILPVTRIIIEIQQFDIQKAVSQAMVGKNGQQAGKRAYGNIRAYAMARDGYRCQHCGSGKDLQVHHIIPRSQGGSDRPGNLVTLCRRCHHGHHNGKPLMLSPRDGFLGFSSMSDMNAMRGAILDRLTAMYSDKEVVCTYGYITYCERKRLGLPKAHHIDARCITGNGRAVSDGSFLIITKRRSHNRQIHKINILKGGRRRMNQAPRFVKGFRVGDIVRFKGQECFIYTRMSSGQFDVRKLDGTPVSPGAYFKQLTLIRHSSNARICKAFEEP